MTGVRESFRPSRRGCRLVSHLPRPCVLLIAVAVLAASGCGGTHVAASTSGAADSPPSRSRTASHAPASLRLATRTRLPAAVQLPSVAAEDGGVLALGGLDAADTSVASIVVVDANGAREVGQLPLASHDGTAANVNGQVYFFGGGDAGSASASILRVVGGTTHAAGRLPAAASDVAAASIGRTAYVVGGYTETIPLRTIVAFSPGRAARIAGMLPRPLRYAAVAAVAGRLLIAGGTSGTAAQRAILSFDPGHRRRAYAGPPAPSPDSCGGRVAGRALLRARRPGRGPHQPDRGDPRDRPTERGGAVRRTPARAAVGPRRRLAARPRRSRRRARHSRERPRRGPDAGAGPMNPPASRYLGGIVAIALALGGCGGGSRNTSTHRTTSQSAGAHAPTAPGVPVAGAIPPLLDLHNVYAADHPADLSPIVTRRSGARLRAQQQVEHGRCHLAADLQDYPTVPGRSASPARHSVLGSAHALCDERCGQQPHPDRSSHGPSRKADPGSRPIQHVLHSRRALGDHRRRGPSRAGLPGRTFDGSSSRARDTAVRGRGSHGLHRQRALRARLLRVRRTDDRRRPEQGDDREDDRPGCECDASGRQAVSGRPHLLRGRHG